MCLRVKLFFQLAEILRLILTFKITWLLNQFVYRFIFKAKANLPFRNIKEPLSRMWFYKVVFWVIWKVTLLFLFWILSPKRLPISYSNTLEAGFEPAYLVVTLTPELFRIAPEVGFEPTTHNVLRQKPAQSWPVYSMLSHEYFGAI